MSTKISIIVPVYNVGAFLPDCLDSLIGQTYPDLEIICVNDGSTDRSPQILEEYARWDPRIRIVTKENGGLSSARNHAMITATGEYVMYVDSDDWIDRDICRLALEEAKATGADLVFWSYTREFQNGSKPKDVLGKERVHYDAEGVRRLYRRLFGLLGPELAEPEKNDTLVTAWGKLYRRELIKDIQYQDTKEVGTEDCLFSIEAFRRLRSAVYLPIYAYHYRKYNAASLTTVYNPHLFRRWQTMYSRMADHIQLHGLDDEYQKALSSRRAVHLIILGSNVMASDKSPLGKIRELKEITHHPAYREAFRKLELKHMPIHWKVFFGFARMDWATGVYLLLVVIQKIRGR